MKVFGKKTLVIDCSWELEGEDETKLRTKLESLTDREFIDYCFENGKFEEGLNHNPGFEIGYIGKIGEDF